jgi:ElaA protein
VRAEGPGLIAWRCARFEDLGAHELHEIFRARLEVFVVEQNCAFQDLDGADPDGWHLIGSGGEGELVAYCRLLPPGVKYAEPSIGRVLTTAAVRGTGAGRDLMVQALGRAESLWPGQPIRIGAQHRLERFYRSLGFETCSALYIEDGIPHVEMLLRKGRT